MQTSQEAELRGTEWLGRAGLRPTRQRLSLARLLVGDGEDRHVTAESQLRIDPCDPFAWGIQHQAGSQDSFG